MSNALELPSTVRALKSARVVLADQVAAKTLVLRAGKIEEILDYTPEGLDVLDCGELAISPGLVDCHVHINEPGRTEWEGFATATRAAAAGGVTSLVDMPLNSSPVTTTRAALELKLQACEGQRHVDVGFWGGVIPSNAVHLRDLWEGGVLGCKTFLVHSGIDEFPHTTEDDLRRSMPVLRDLGLPLLVHAELDLGANVAEPNPRAYAGYLQSRPHEWEDAAIRMMIRLCRETKCEVHIVHLSSAHALPALRDAKAEGLPITVETCPHYLCFDAEAIPDGATFYKCAPPIREHDNREALWRGLLDGVIDFVITDHSPCTPQLKLPEQGDFHGAWGGIASLQLGLSAIWTEASRRGATLCHLARWMSQAPAVFAGLGGRKGRICVGAEADLVVWDPDAEFVPRLEQLFFRHRLSPYLGKTLRGKVRATLLSGVVVYDGHGHPAGAVGKTLLHRH
jgi:allantoinase